MIHQRSVKERAEVRQANLADQLDAAKPVCERIDDNTDLCKLRLDVVRGVVLRMIGPDDVDIVVANVHPSLVVEVLCGLGAQALCI